MKTSIFFAFLLIVVACGKPKKLQISIANVQNIMKEYAPCHEGWYCYEYEFELNNKMLVITTRRFNYNQEERFLALKAIYEIPIEKINTVEQFPATDDSIIIKTKEADIKIFSEEETTRTDYLALDFNQLFAYDKQMSIMLNDLEKIINFYREVP